MAAVGAGIGIGVVAIIAGFAGIGTPIAADFSAAGLRTAIGGLDIAVIAFLIALFFGLKIAAQDTVTAARQLTGRGAGISLNRIAIIAGFKAGNADVEIRAHLPITTARRSATAQTGVGIDIVAIITAFAFLEDAIAATCGPAVGARIGRIIIAIITALTWAHHAITTTRQGTVTQTGIGIVFVAVIAGLKSAVGILQIRAQNPVTAMGDDAQAQTAVTVEFVTIITGFKTRLTFS